MIEFSIAIIEFYNSIVAQFDKIFASIGSSLMIYSSILLICIIFWVIGLAMKLIFSKTETTIFDIIKSDSRRLIITLFFLYGGFTVMTIIEETVKFIEVEIVKSGNDFFGEISDDNTSDNDIEADKIYKSFIENSGTLGKDVFEYNLIQEGKDGSKILSKNEADKVDEIISKYGVNTTTDDDDPLLASAHEFIKENKTENKSLWNFSISEFISEVCFFLSTLIQVLIRTIRMFFIILLKFAFPIAVMLSLIPKMEKTWTAWFESYITVLMWGITLSLIIVVSTFLHSALKGASAGGQFFIVIFQIVAMFCYILSPTITVMLFGGSQAMNSLTSAMSTSTALFLWKYTKQGGGEIGKGSISLGKNIKDKLTKNNPTDSPAGAE